MLDFLLNSLIVIFLYSIPSFQLGLIRNIITLLAIIGLPILLKILRWPRPFLVYIFLTVCLGFIDFIQSSYDFAGLLVAVRRISYLTIPGLLLLRKGKRSKRSASIGALLNIAALVNWFFIPHEMDEWGRVANGGIVVSRLSAGVLASVGSVLLARELWNTRKQYSLVLLGTSVLSAAFWLSLIYGAKTGILIIITFICVFIVKKILFYSNQKSRHNMLELNISIKHIIVIGLITAFFVIMYQKNIFTSEINSLLTYLIGDQYNLSSSIQRLIELEAALEVLKKDIWTFLFGCGWLELDETVRDFTDLEKPDHMFQSVIIDGFVAYGMLLGILFVGVIMWAWMKAFKIDPILSASLWPLLLVNSFAPGNGYEATFWTVICCIYATTYERHVASENVLSSGKIESFRLSCRNASR